MRFTIQGNVLTIRFQGWERVWALKRVIILPREQIAHMEWKESLPIPSRDICMRVGGTSAVVLQAGRFWGAIGKSFLYLKRTRGWVRCITAPHVLRMDLQGNYYAHLFFTVDDLQLVQHILAWWTLVPEQVSE
jgi:hypothetical protein